MNIPCTATMIDGTRVHGQLMTIFDAMGEALGAFLTDNDTLIGWAEIASIDTFADARSRGGRANTPAQKAARAANAARPVREGSKPRGRPRKHEKGETK